MVLRQVFENAADGMFIIDNNSNIMEVNHRLVILLGVSKEDLIGQKCYKFYSSSLCNTNECPMKRIKGGEYYITYEMEQKIKDRIIHLFITVTPLFTVDQKIEGIILTIKDITTIAKYQQELNKAKHEAEESNMLKTQILANMSHEIRTTMNGIIGLTELLEDTELDNIQREYINMLRFSSDKLVSVINDILDLSKIEAGKLQQMNNIFNLPELLRDIASYFKLQANKKGLDFYYNKSCDIPSNIIGDSDKLYQVLFNIISNAIKFTENGWVSLRLDVYYEDVDYLDIKFIIIDTGIGIPNGKIDSIFEGFSQLDSSAEKKHWGTGLGLTISKKLIELMGGEIEVRSRQGEGSVFSFNLKFLKHKLENSRGDSFNLKNTSKGSSIFSNLNILVAEDDLVNQKIIKAILEKNNWTVNIVSNGKEVLEYLNHNNMDMILMDISMPEIDGFEVAKIIRKREKTRGRYTPIIALTAAVMKEDKERCLKIGMDGYISKPIESNMLYQTIIDILDRKNKMSDLNIEQLLERIDGDKNVLAEIIKEVLSDEYEEEYIGNMELNIGKENYEAFNKQIHKFRGSISNFGAISINNILDKIVESIRMRDLYTIKKLFKELKIEFNKTKNNLEKYIKY